MPLFWISLVFLGGIVLADCISRPTWFWLGCAAVALACLWRRYLSFLLWTRLSFAMRGCVSALPRILLRRLVRMSAAFYKLALPVPGPILVCALCLGGARYQIALPDLTPESLAWYNDRGARVIIEGVIVEPPDECDGYTNLRVQAGRLQLMDELLLKSVKGRLAAQVPAGESWRYGDRISLAGYLNSPPQEEAFSYQAYLARQGIASVMQVDAAQLMLRSEGNPILAAIYAFRRRAQQVIYQIFPDPEASLLAGILLGIEAGIPASVKEAFRVTGAAHIIAISGFNISIVAAIFTVLAARLFGRWRGAVLAAAAIGVYTVMVGANASVVRAALIGWLSLLGSQIGRRQQGLNSLAVVAGVMAVLNPMVIWDVSFQLSFAATMGLVLYADPFTQAFQALVTGMKLPKTMLDQLLRLTREYVLLTLAAQLITFPVILYHFQRLSFSSLIANPLILPAQPAVMILGGLAVLGGLVYLPIGQALSYLAWPFVLFTIRAVEFIASFPKGEAVSGQVSLLAVIGFYGLLFCGTFLLRRIPERIKQVAATVGPAAPLLLLVLAVIYTWSAAWQRPDGLLHLTVLDIGAEPRSGEAVLIQSPTGRYLLVNGGPSASQLSDALGRELPFTNRSLDYLIVAGVGEGQLAALPAVLPRYPPEQILWAGATHASRAARNLYDAVLKEALPWQVAQSGSRLELGGGASLHFLTSGKRGAILLLEWEHFRALMPLGASLEDFDTLRDGQSIGNVSALILGDSGYAPSNPPEWLANLHPQTVLLSVSSRDAYGNPSPETLQSLQGYTILRTDTNGCIQISTDGRQMWVEADR